MVAFSLGLLGAVIGIDQQGTGCGVERSDGRTNLAVITTADLVEWAKTR
jgi:hypothetical protein